MYEKLIHKMQQNNGRLPWTLQSKEKRKASSGIVQPPLNKQINKAHACHAQDLRTKRNKNLCHKQGKFVWSEFVVLNPLDCITGEKDS